MGVEATSALLPTSVGLPIASLSGTEVARNPPCVLPDPPRLDEARNWRGKGEVGQFVGEVGRVRGEVSRNMEVLRYDDDYPTLDPSEIQ